MALKGMGLKRAQRYLNDVLARKDCIPVRRYLDGIGRCAQAKRYGVTQGSWPVKSCKFLLDLLQNAESNADIQGLEADTLVVYHIQVNRAPKLRRRTYRAHGRIGPYMSNPCHIELILSQKGDQVKKATDSEVSAGAGALTTQPKRGGKKKLQSGATAADA